ncbi:MAG: hypothetical protein AAFZ52_19455, partial [Bacteroidota bacterium]
IIKTLEADFRPLALAGRQLPDVPSILKRMAGLPSVTHVLKELELKNKPPVKAGSLVDQLKAHPDTFHVGALVANLISGLQISFHASLPSQQPLGGVADITNKGSIDKLLTSEYAFDDHVLLSRLANNEALYKHREAPPVDNTSPRVLLIDTTLKNWGTIRTISFATAMAVTEHPKNKLPCRVFLVGESYQEIAVTTVAEVIGGLNALDPSLDPGVGIANLIANENIKGSEVFFLGAATSVSQPEMQHLATHPAIHIDHWIHPEESGVLKVYRNPRRGKRFVQELKLPLDDLWARPKTSKQIITANDDADYPILFPEPRMKSTWRGKEFLYGLTKDKALVRTYAGQDRADRGWEFIATGIRPADQLKAVITHDDLSVTVLLATQAKEYTVISFPNGEPIRLTLDRHLEKVKRFYVEDGCFKADVLRTTVRIDVRGRITKQVADVRKQGQDKPFQRQHSSILRHVAQVCITSDNKLRFKNHDLMHERNALV